MPARPGAKSSVSVVLRTENAERSLPRLLHSLENQKYAPCELLIHDSGSTDGTREIIDGFVTHAPFGVRLIGTEPKTRAQAYSDVVGAAAGDVIAMADQTDLWVPRKTLRVAKAFDTEPELGVAVGDAWLVNKRLDETGVLLWDALLFASHRKAALALGAGSIPHNHWLVKALPLERLLPFLATTFLAPGSRPAFKNTLKDVILPIPEHPIEEWIVVLAALLHPFRLMTEPLQHIVPPDVPWMLASRRRPDHAKGRFGRIAKRFRTALKWFDEEASTEARKRRVVEGALLNDAADRLDATRAAHAGRTGIVPSEAAEAAIVDLREQARHLLARGSLPPGRMRRLGPVLREARSGGYGRYARFGTVSVLRDLTV